MPGASHEDAVAAQNQAGGKKGPLVWQKPKIDHAKQFMLRLMQTPIKLVVVCMRAKYPMEEIVKNGKKEWARSEKLEPKQSEDILYEMFVHGWIDREHRFRATKYTRPDLAQIIKDNEPISIATGEALAQWAAGGKSEPIKKEEPSGLLAEVLAGIDMAQSEIELKAVIGHAEKLTAADKDAARNAYKNKLAELSK